ncbi:MAG: hypothetical protein ACLRNJ_06275 [Faecalibacterium prausnitzii]
MGQARPNKKLSQRGKNFQELKICGHGTILALYRCAQNTFLRVVSELLRRKTSKGSLLVYDNRRSRRTKFLPLICSGVGWKAGITFGRLMKFSRYVPHKRKIPPTQRSDDFVGVNRRQNESGVLRGGKSSQEIKPHRIVSLQKSLWICWE